MRDSDGYLIEVGQTMTPGRWTCTQNSGELRPVPASSRFNGAEGAHVASHARRH